MSDGTRADGLCGGRRADKGARVASLQTSDSLRDDENKASHPSWRVIVVRSAIDTSMALEARQIHPCEHRSYGGDLVVEA